VTLFFGHLDDDEQVARNPRVDGALAKVSPRSRSENRAWGQCTV
jgi:hypothetical protein